MMKETLEQRGRKHIASCFLVYLAVLVYFLLFAERPGDSTGYNTTPFAEIMRYCRYVDTIGWGLVIRNLVGNIVGFVPFGCLLPMLNKNYAHFVRTVFVCFLFSLTIEMVQLFTHVGCFDVDDVILNTIGGVIGYFVYFTGNYLRRKKYASGE